MNTTKAASKAVQNAFRLVSDPLETLKSQVAKPLVEEFGHELGGFLGSSKSRFERQQTLAQEDLARARNKQKLNEENNKDDQKSQQEAQEIITFIKQEYRVLKQKTKTEQSPLKEQVLELQSEIARLAKTEGIETKAHLQNTGQKVGIIDIKFFTSIVRLLRVKAEESKSAKELTSQRQNAKRSTGMLAWVSGKQMKVYEQGTLTLQG